MDNQHIHRHTGEGGRCLQLLLTFLKIGAFTFGGGYAMIPLIEREMVQEKKWITEDEMMDMIAISESTPGPLAINAATFVGYQTAGFQGAFCATFGVTLPSFLIMLLVSWLMRRYENLTVVNDAFIGIRAAVLVLILQAFLSMFRQMKKSPASFFLLAGTFTAVVVFHVSAVYVILAGILIGVIGTSVRVRRGKEDR